MFYKFILIGFLILIIPLFGQATDSTKEKHPNPAEDWEKELDKEIKELETDSTPVKKESLREETKPQAKPILQNPLMMDIMAAVDILGQWDKNKEKTTSNSLDVRSVEVGFSGYADHWLKGNLLVAAHREDGEYKYDIHEANIYLPFTNRYATVKAGKMLMDMGRLNRIHQHDWLFSMAPLVHSKLMGKEAVSDTGAEINILFPWKSLTQELVLGATNGRNWDHSHKEGAAKNNPLTYLHLKNFYSFGSGWSTQFGFTGIRYEPDPSTTTVRYQYGMDFIVKWFAGNYASFQLLGEVWYRETRYPDKLNLSTFQKEKIPMNTQVGYYLFFDWQFLQNWFLGLRYDFYTIPNLRDKNGYLAVNYETAYTPQLTYKPSEFSRVRLSVERSFYRDDTVTEIYLDPRPISEILQETYSNGRLTESHKTIQTYQVYLQCTFILGAHPPHLY